MSSIRRKDPYSWIVCEGSSEKIYFEHFFKEESNDINLRILPVGGAKEVKRLFQYLELPIKEDKKAIKGKVFCLIDTDTNLIRFTANDDDRMHIRRLLGTDKGVQLVTIEDQRSAPPTEIEDALDAETFRSALETFAEEYTGIADVLSSNTDIFDPSKPSGAAFDWRPSDAKKIKEFFSDNEGKNKLRFARKYVEISEGRKPQQPPWVQEIRQWLKPEPVKLKGSS
jgi:hypothetical protein